MRDSTLLMFALQCSFNSLLHFIVLKIVEPVHRPLDLLALAQAVVDDAELDARLVGVFSDQLLDGLDGAQVGLDVLLDRHSAAGAEFIALALRPGQRTIHQGIFRIPHHHGNSHIFASIQRLLDLELAAFVPVHVGVKHDLGALGHLGDARQALDCR